jgi:hypothetical protein
MQQQQQERQEQQEFSFLSCEESKQPPSLIQQLEMEMFALCRAEREKRKHHQMVASSA